jgi:poly(beta-D-mannuronate) lyase
MIRPALTIAMLVASSGAALAQVCVPPPPPVRNLDIPRFYATGSNSVVDPAALADHDAAVAPLTAFVRRIVQDADKSLRRTGSGQGELAACTLDALAAWARAGAYLGIMAQSQAEYQREWDLAGLALAYLKLKAHASPEHRRTIEPWLMRVADAVLAFQTDPKRDRNNHWYWTGLGLAAVGIGSDSPRHWNVARGIMQDAARDISAAGHLPKEMQRQGRALFYHVFSVMPLVVLAELGAARREDWYALSDGALHRLVRAVHAGLKDPAPFATASGATQETPANARAGWLQLYEARFPGRLVPPHPDVAEGNRWIGGHALLLRDVLRAR